ncbi:MAG TPA: hypothetical protein VNX01_15675 [Bacteroidia bacterium]|jgi:hypothetical protein|nr:hypothetical protein [Bacteroidia bacterium]
MQQNQDSLIYIIFATSFIIGFFILLNGIYKNSKEQVRLLKKLNNEVDEIKPKTDDRNVDKSYIQ